MSRVELLVRYLIIDKGYAFRKFIFSTFGHCLSCTDPASSEQQTLTMHVMRLLKISFLSLLMLAHATQSAPLVTLDGSKQDAAARHSSLRVPRDSHTTDSYHREPSLAEPLLLKRAGRPLGQGLTLHAFHTATYIGARIVLENLYSQLFAEASNRPPGTMTNFEAEYGEVAVVFSSDQPFSWELIKEFSSMMLSRVLNGEQNFYIADIVVGYPQVLGQFSVRFLMGTPDTRQSIANEPWAGTLKEWIDRHW